VVIAALTSGHSIALAQPATPDMGTIDGVVRLATPGVVMEPTVVELVIDRADSDEFESIEQPVAADGSFAFEVEADPSISYYAVVRYGGIPYLSNQLLVSPEIPSASVDFEVYAASMVEPDLTIEATTVTLLAIDRQNAALTLVREDLVRHDEPVIYVGDESGTTLRIPVPDATFDAGGFDDAEAYVFEGGIISVGTALRPGVTSIVTRYTVRYEADEDEYRLRITAPLPAQHVEIRIPQRFLREVRPEGDEAVRGEDDEFEGEPLTVIERAAPAGPGQSLVADLLGLSGVERASHPLTSGVGAAVGAILALLVVAGVAVVLHRRVEPAR